MAIDDFIAELKNDEEALALLSAFGFSFKDWSFIERVGGALKTISSDVVRAFIREKAHKFCLETELKEVRGQFDRFYQNGGYLISPLSDPSSRLFKCRKAPLVFYGRYNRELVNKTPAVAVVGSRSASHWALQLTKELSSVLAKHAINVVSGGAMGIDQAAHKGALEAFGTTVIIPGLICDLYDVKSRKFDNIDALRLALIYPFGPFNPQGKFMFVERNSFVVSLADALVIVQGKIGSGTLHTAAFAKGLQIPIYAIPGAIKDPLSYAPNYVLETGAGRALVNFEQFAKSLVTKDKPPKKNSIALKEGISHQELKPNLPYLLQVIHDHGNGLYFDELLKLTDLTLADLQKELLSYELSGRLMKRGSQFVLTGE